MTTATGRRRTPWRSSARTRRAEASGSSGSRQTVLGFGEVGAVDSGVRADETLVGFDDQRVCPRRAGPRGSPRGSARPGPVPCRALRPACGPRRPGSRPRGSAPCPRPWRRSCGRRRRRRRPRARQGRRRARHSRALRDLGQGGDRGTAETVAHIPSALAVRRAAPRPRSAISLVRATRSAGVSRSRAREESSSTEKGTLPRGRPRRGGRSCPRRRQGGSPSGGARTRAFVPSPWRSGTIAT